MYSLDEPFVIIVAAVVALFTALAGSRLAMETKMLPDRPNHRSSHQRVTSRAGGIAIIAAWVSGMFILGAFSASVPIAVKSFQFVVLTGAAFAIGLADDHWTFRPGWKFAGQVGVAILFVLVIGSLETAPLPFLGQTSLGLWGALLTILWIVGFMNVFNFMDGLNGIAAGNAALGLAAFTVIAVFTGAPLAAAMALLMALACFGFLPANLGRGRLFMGDSGSHAIGFLIAALAVDAANTSGGVTSIFVAPVIFLPFILDVIWTLAHRLLRKQNILNAHREHLYQLRSRLGQSHANVTIHYMTLTAFAVTAAIFMLTLPPDLQAVTPLALSALFCFAAAHTHQKAIAAGIFDGPEASAVERRLDAAPTNPAS